MHNLVFLRWCMLGSDLDSVSMSSSIMSLGVLQPKYQISTLRCRMRMISQRKSSVPERGLSISNDILHPQLKRAKQNFYPSCVSPKPVHVILTQLNSDLDANRTRD